MKHWSKILIFVWILLSVFFFDIPGKIEGKYFPAIENFSISNSVATDNGFFVYGSFDEIRECKFENIELFSVEDTVAIPFDISFKEIDKIQRKHKQEFGPWFIKVKDFQTASLRMVARHSCHPFWQTVTVTEETLLRRP